MRRKNKVCRSKQRSNKTHRHAFWPCELDLHMTVMLLFHIPKMHPFTKNKQKFVNQGFQKSEREQRTNKQMRPNALPRGIRR